jgi:hypothetical protein
MTIRLPFTTMAPPSVTTRVRCNGRLHRISLRANALVLHDHTRTSLELTAALHAPTRCAVIRDAVLRGHDAALPPPLKRALRSTMRLYRRRPTGDTTIRLARNPYWSARGRNGCFDPDAVTLYRTEFNGHRTMALEILSARDYRVGPPIRLEGDPAAMVALFDAIRETLQASRHGTRGSPRATMKFQPALE